VSYFQRLIMNTLTFVTLAVLLPNMIHVQSIMTALTLGFFTFVINALMLNLTSYFVGSANFGFSSFGAALLVALIMSVINMIVTEHHIEKYSR